MRSMRDCNIWNLTKEEDDLVIPTSIGWRTNGKAVMGRGLARDATRYYPSLPAWYGECCSAYGTDTPVLRYGPLLLFPVKPLDEFQPYYSWKQPPSMDLVARSLEQLSQMVLRPSGFVFIPLVGCWGSEALDREDIRSLIEAVLGDNDRFILFEKDGIC